MANNDKWCFSWYAPEPGSTGQNRAGLQKASKWDVGEIITISFLDGDPSVQARVRAVAQEWTAPGMANLTLSFRTDTTDTDIRISFQFPGSWSVLGKTCRNIPAPQATMNYGWLTAASTDDEVRRVVLHEFGHALGLIHEHQNPAGGINWDKPAVTADLSGPPNNWNLATIEFNMFTPQAAAETNFTALDPTSIMMYPIPAHWTTDGFSTGLNTDLSPTDRQFIQDEYS